jgi:hypothetical protein
MLPSIVAFISPPAFAISQLLFVHNRCVVASTFDSFLRYIFYLFVSMQDPRGQNLLRLLGAVTPRKFISNFEDPYLHSIDRQGRKYCAGKIPRAWACMPRTRCGYVRYYLKSGHSPMRLACLHCANRHRTYSITSSVRASSAGAVSPREVEFCRVFRHGPPVASWRPVCIGTGRAKTAIGLSIARLVVRCRLGW